MKRSLTCCIALLFWLPHLATAQNKAAAACYTALEKDKPQEALTSADNQLRADPVNREVLLCKGRAHSELKQYDEGLVALQAAEKLSTRTTDHVIALLMIGNLQKEAGKLPEAVASYNKALDDAKANNDKSLQRLALNVIGLTQVEAGQMKEALHNFELGVPLAANDNERSENYGHLAAAHSRLGNHDQAIEYQIKAMLMLERVGEPDEYANAGLELGRFYMAAKMYDQAETTINKILKFARDNGSAYWEARSNYMLGLNKVEQGDIDAGRTLLLDAHHNARRIGATSLAGEIGNIMIKLPSK